MGRRGAISVPLIVVMFLTGGWLGYMSADDGCHKVTQSDTDGPQFREWLQRITGDECSFG
jgi:hypothetical protein